MFGMSVNTFSDWLLNVLDSKGDILPEWILEDEPKIVNGLLTRLFRGIKIMGDGSVVPVLRN